MNNISDTLKVSVIQYCSTIGVDPLLVQGAGGNVSWKDGDTLWIKASGTWLAEAAAKDIFVPVDLPHLRTAIEIGDFSVCPRVHEESVLRPSIETLLHALMQHRVVVHLHAIEILAHLVRDNWKTNFQSLLDASPSIHWTAVAYKKPGAELAEAVNLALRAAENTNVVFLQNHGVVIGGANTREIDHILKTLTDALQTSPLDRDLRIWPSKPISIDGRELYYPISDHAIHQLAIDAGLFSLLESNWALYPDHVVFLGARPNTFADKEALQDELRNSNKAPELVFIQNLGVFAKSGFSIAKQVQLRCYYDVLVRQQEEHVINSLTSQQIGELLNWDAEQYRMSLAK